ncbi:MAG TPA: hypothetical protein VMB05_13080 [Solirubrobacteraceae bacterium]|nr:hypothetical protein [Solirubrobacteraceae bacterium]
MPRTPLPLLLALGALALCSCGKGGARTVTVSASSQGAGTSSTPNGGAKTNSTPGGSTTQPDEASPNGKKPSQGRALAFARAVNLTADDVPGFTPSEKHDDTSAREKRLESEMVKCAGTSAGLHAGSGGAAGESKALAEQSSKDFQLKHGVIDFSVSSQVSVQNDAGEARKALQAIRSAHVRDCFSHFLKLLFEGEHLKGAKVGPVSIQAGVPPAPGTTGGFGWRITASFFVRGVKVPVYLDFLGFVDGPAEVTLLSSGLIRPFPAEVQQQLFSLLLSRAKGHKL